TSRSRILPEDLPRDIRQTNPQDIAAGSVVTEALPLSEAVERLEKEMILKALEKASGVLGEAAKQLGITRRVLAYKMESLGIKGKNGTKL
ncbi:unnamed protein product, partial [marine sediment metagenome]